LKARPRSAHRLLCRWLSGALGQELQFADLPASEDEWQNVLRLSGGHLVTALLRWATREQGLCSSLPTDIGEFLDAVCALNLDRNNQLEQQLIHLTQRLNSVGVRPVLLKGAAALVGGLYPESSDRMIGDIDVLIPVHQLPDILKKLGLAGYRRAAEDGELPNTEMLVDRHHHYPTLANADWPALVDLHVHPVALLAQRLLPNTEVFQEATAFPWRGVELALPSPNHFMMHNIIHAYLMDFARCGFLSLRQLFEFVHGSRIHGSKVDWPAIIARFESVGHQRALRAYSAYANVYLGFRGPSALTTRGWARYGPALHRMRADHLSHPAIELPIAIASVMKDRARNLRKAPSKLRKLFTRDFYSQNWKFAKEVSRRPR
jgi:hypothetical protein